MRPLEEAKEVRPPEKLTKVCSVILYGFMQAPCSRGTPSRLTGRLLYKV